MELDGIIQRSIVTQTLENEYRQMKIKKLKDAVSTLGFNVLQNVPYDGNCFFHAVGLLFGKDGHLFREETVRFIEQEVDRTPDTGSNIFRTELNDTTQTDVQLQQTTIQEPTLDDTTPDLNSTQEKTQSLYVPTLTRDEISSYPNDIGSIFRPNMSSMEASSTAMSLNDQQRYNLLTNHFTPSQNYEFKPERL
ncbi:unnamed protein product [Mytilus coruscus]|uniref:OTU domain-containing protein n=1 Tax=Mytilus coruscus TaxID=42192 RepID=A0A6J8B7E2_MYTCO|nr:unnamed protein product [Mytilus coruscus]